MNYKELINSQPVVLVEFYATWCPHCMRMMPVVAQVKELLDGQAAVEQIDIDKYAKIADAEGIEGTPTFILYRNGKEVWRDSGEMPGQELYNRVESVVDKQPA